MTNISIKNIEENLKTKTFIENNLSNLWNIEQTEWKKIITNRRINTKQLPKILKSHIWILTQRKPTKQWTSKKQPFKCQYCSKEFPPKDKPQIFEHRQTCNIRLERITHTKNLLNLTPNSNDNSNKIHSIDHNAIIFGTK
eukprot:Pgem_evm1s14562